MKKFAFGGLIPASEINKHINVKMHFDQVPKIEIPNVRWILSIRCSPRTTYKFWSGEILNTTPN